jgi:hypothetical protein
MSEHVKQMVPSGSPTDTDRDSKPGDGTDCVDGAESLDSAELWGVDSARVWDA